MKTDNEEDLMKLNVSAEPLFVRKKVLNKTKKTADVIEKKAKSPTKKPPDQVQSSFDGRKTKTLQKYAKKRTNDGTVTEGRFSKGSGEKKQYISSLFKSNPEIPHIQKCNDNKIKELLFAESTFSDLDLHPHLVSCLESRFGASKMTEVQCRTIPKLLEGKDVLVKSCTGSGKTLAYAIPIVQQLQLMDPKIDRSDGTFALVVLPTRELALQSYECFSNLTKAFTWIVPGYLIGGEKKKSEKARIRKGINILVSTPGRLLDHLDHTANLSFEKVCWLVIDEADRLLEEGFEDSAMKIVRRVKEDKKFSKLQTALLSATLSKGVEKLAGMSLVDPVCIDISSRSGSSGEMMDLVVPVQLKQFVIVIPTKLRLVTLSAFIVDKCSKGDMKALIFMCTQNSVDFHFILFNFILKTMLKFKGYKTKFFKLHGNMKQEDRTEVFGQFKSAKNGILLCTDVAARGLHLPEVDWIIQYSAPVSAENYVHRVGRTARIGKQGQSLIFLIPSEIKFVSLLQKHKIFLEEMNMESLLNSLYMIADVIQENSKQSFRQKSIEEHASALQLKYEDIVYSEDTYHNCAKEAFLSFVQAYSSYPKDMRSVIPFKLLHLGHVAKSFCLREAPSELGCNFAKKRPPSSFKNLRPGKQVREKTKRKMTAISEFDSGLNEWKDDLSHSVKRKKVKR